MNTHNYKKTNEGKNERARVATMEYPMGGYVPRSIRLPPSDADALLEETITLYGGIIAKVKERCEGIISKVGYRSFMAQFFEKWYARTYEMLQRRMYADPTPPAPAIRRTSASSSAAAAAAVTVKRPHSEDEDEDAQHSPRKRARTGDKVAEVAVKQEAPDEETASTAKQEEQQQAVKEEVVEEGARKDGEDGEGAADDDDEELRSDLDDDDDDDDDMATTLDQDVNDVVVCLSESISKPNKKVIRRVVLRDGIISVTGTPDIFFRKITAQFKCG